MTKSLGAQGALLDAPWPQVDQKALLSETTEYVIQINGKLRGHLQTSSSADKEQVEQASLENETVRRYTDGREIRKIIVVPGRLVNVVC